MRERYQIRWKGPCLSSLRFRAALDRFEPALANDAASGTDETPVDCERAARFVRLRKHARFGREARAVEAEVHHRERLRGDVHADDELARSIVDEDEET